MDKLNDIANNIEQLITKNKSFVFTYNSLLEKWEEILEVCSEKRIKIFYTLCCKYSKESESILLSGYLANNKSKGITNLGQLLNYDKYLQDERKNQNKNYQIDQLIKNFDSFYNILFFKNFNLIIEEKYIELKNEIRKYEKANPKIISRFPIGVFKNPNEFYSRDDLLDVNKIIEEKKEILIEKKFDKEVALIIDFYTHTGRTNDIFDKIEDGGLIIKSINSMLLYWTSINIFLNILTKDDYKDEMDTINLLVSFPKKEINLDDTISPLQNTEIIVDNLENDQFGPSIIESGLEVVSKRMVTNFHQIINILYNHSYINKSYPLMKNQIYKQKFAWLSLLNTFIQNDYLVDWEKLSSNNDVQISELKIFLKKFIHQYSNEAMLRMDYILNNFIVKGLKNDFHLETAPNRSKYLNLVYLDKNLKYMQTLREHYIQEMVIGPIGSGKSNYIKEFMHRKKNEDIFRIIFSPSITRDNFIGYVNNDEFIPGIFTLFYIKSLTNLIGAIIGVHYEENVFENDLRTFLVIEELNRGYALDILDFCSNLLDRKNGFSCYPINISHYQKDYITNEVNNFISESSNTDNENLLDMLILFFPELDGLISYKINADYIEKTRDSGGSLEVNKEMGIQEDKLIINKITFLPNMNIFCSMNTYDENINDIDYMLFRRFSIKNILHNTQEKPNLIFIENLPEEESYSWNNLLKIINAKIEKLISEDKCLALYFLSGNDYIGRKISENAIKNKLIYFLYYKVLQNKYTGEINLKYFFGNLSFNKIMQKTTKEIYDLLINNCTEYDETTNEDIGIINKL